MDINTLKLEDIETLARAPIELIWRAFFKTSLPKGLSITLARPIIAHEWQIHQYGDVDKRTKQALNKAMGRIKATSPPRLIAGSQIIREWNGVTHVVEVQNDGYIWKHKHYRSLTAIAKAITGAHWSGPRFFNLNACKASSMGDATNG